MHTQTQFLYQKSTVDSTTGLEHILIRSSASEKSPEFVQKSVSVLGHSCDTVE